MELVRPDGSAVAPAATEVKKAHDPAELQRERARLDAFLDVVMKEALGALANNPNKPVTVQADEESVVAQADKRWREQADALNASGFPHRVDPDLVKKLLGEVLGEQRRQADLQRPIYQVTNELQRFELYLLKDLGDARLYLNTASAVLVYATGRTLVWVRPVGTEVADWAAIWAAGELDHLPPVVESDGYTLEELHSLWRALRVSTVTAVPTELLTVDAPKPGEPKSWLKKLGWS